MRYALFLMVLLTAAGCAPGNPGLVIGNVIAPDDQCAFSASGAALPVGIFDLAVADNSYEAVLRFNNQLINLSQTGSSGFPIMADPNVINVGSVEIELRDIGGVPLALGADFPSRFALAAGTVTIPSGDGMAAGEALGFVQLIPPAYRAELAAVAGNEAMIVVAISAVGTTLGGAEVVSNEYIFPVRLCTGCLSPGCLVDAEGANICRPACRPGQDQVHVSCDATCVVGG